MINLATDLVTDCIPTWYVQILLIQHVALKFVAQHAFIVSIAVRLLADELIAAFLVDLDTLQEMVPPAFSSHFDASEQSFNCFSKFEVQKIRVHRSNLENKIVRIVFKIRVAYHWHYTNSGAVGVRVIQSGLGLPDRLKWFTQGIHTEYCYNFRNANRKCETECSSITNQNWRDSLSKECLKPTSTGQRYPSKTY